MLLLFLYSLGWIIAITRLLKINYGAPTKALPILDRLLLWVIYLVPLGKLVYFHVPGLIGFKLVFLIWSIICLLFLGYLFSTKRSGFHRLTVLTIFLFFPFLSLMLRGNFAELIYYSADNQVDSLGARFIALMFLMIFSIAIFDLSLRRGIELVLRFFLDGVMMALFIGIIIFALVFMGMIGVADLEPLSADTHIVGSIYRFNPGGNVNEFGLIAIYGLLWARFAYPFASKFKQFAIYGLLIFALFFSLTRAAWLAYAGSLIVMALVSGHGRKLLFVGASSFAIFTYFIYQLNNELANIVVSRFSFDGGPSGEERLNKIASAFSFNAELNWLELLFGKGWATNLYLHSVPLQLIYEIGILGFLLITGTLVWTFFKLVMRARQKVPGALESLGCLVAYCIFSSFHHTLYHMQTWFILGLILYIAYTPLQVLQTKKSYSNLRIQKVITT